MTINMAKIILRLPTNSETKLRGVIKKFEAETVAIPEDVKILIKNEAGYWKEVGKKRFKLGDMEIEE